MTETFENVKVGDMVTILSDQSKPYKTTKVTKVLKYYFVADDTHFSFTGYQKGGNMWNRKHCIPWEQEHTDYIRLVNARYELKNRFNDEINFLTIDEVQDIREKLISSKHYQKNIKQLLKDL